jgi:hypothetical protein
MSLMQKINAARLQAVKDKRAKLAVDLKRVMMKHNPKEAHKILAAERNAGKYAQPKSMDAGAHYVSRSGRDVSHMAEMVSGGPTPKKETRTVAHSPSALQLVEANTVEALSAMDDETLDAVFGSLKVEQDWLKSKEFSIHPNAKEEATRKRTRQAFAELLEGSDEEE